MKITGVSTHLLTAQWFDDPWFPQALHSTAIIEVQTVSGVYGLGEATLGYFAPEAVPSLFDFFKPVLMGRAPMDRSRLIRDLYDEAVFWGGSAPGRGVIGGLELVLWDLQGNA